MTMPPAHLAKMTHKFLQSQALCQVCHLLYSPDLVPCNFWIFTKLKDELAGREFSTVQDVQKAVTGVCATDPRSEFRAAFKKWDKRWHQCIKLEGGYVKKPGKLVY